MDPAASNLRRADQAPAPRQILANPSAKVKPRAHIVTAKCPPAIGSPKVKPYSQPIPPGRLCNTVIPHTHRGATVAAWWWWFSVSHLHHPKSCVAETSLVPFIQKFIHSSEPISLPDQADPSGTLRGHVSLACPHEIQLNSNFASISGRWEEITHPHRHKNDTLCFAPVVPMITQYTQPCSANCRLHR